MATDIRDLNRQESQAVAIRMSDRLRNLKNKADAAMERTTRLAVSAGSAFGVGIWMGGLDFERRQMIQNGELNEAGEGITNGATDPTKIVGIDKDLVVGLGLTGLTLANIGGKKAQALFAPAALGTLAGWASARGRQMGYDRASEAES